MQIQRHKLKYSHMLIFLTHKRSRNNPYSDSVFSFTFECGHSSFYGGEFVLSVHQCHHTLAGMDHSRNAGCFRAISCVNFIRETVKIAKSRNNSLITWISACRQKGGFVVSLRPAVTFDGRTGFCTDFWSAHGFYKCVSSRWTGSTMTHFIDHALWNPKQGICYR